MDFKKRARRDKKKQGKLGYEEWRKREIERLVMQSRANAETKLEFMNVIRGE
jgi:hypothetical protein